MIGILRKLFSSEAKHLDRAWKIVKQINELEPQVQKMSDAQLSKTAQEYRQRLDFDVKSLKEKPEYRFLKTDPEAYKQQIQEEKQKLLEVLPEVYARVREVAKRVANHRHFDVQLVGGVLLAHHVVIEVYTGEGKTNTALLPAALYGLTGRGVHIHTVNDYLARRDAEWAGHILHKLGLTVAVITGEAAYLWVGDAKARKLKGKLFDELTKDRDLSNMSTLRGANLIKIDKATAYLADVVYGEASEFGFDYLRDNMASTLAERVQRSRYFAIVDEVDSILIDEARTPLIISAPQQDAADLYKRFADIAKRLVENEDYIVDYKHRTVNLTEKGAQKVESLLGQKGIWTNTAYLRHLHNAIKAISLFKRDKDYIVKDGKVVIVDEFTGRLQPDRRYSEGLHQAIEAKEGVQIRQESKTLASISYQNFYKLYDFLAGMTGTAYTEKEEFQRIYGLDVVRVPTYKPIIRKDNPDLIYKTKEAKYRAIVDKITELYKKGQPVLVGTPTIEVSERLSALLKKQGIPHQVLNAKYHEKEAQIIARAGQKGTVTIATNMAGRGTDIKINDEVRKLGGLYVIGAQRHEARRIDNQLRGRTGRLGDPGETQFYLSLEDDLLKIFGGQMIYQLFDRTKLPEDTPLQSRLLSGLIEKAQKKVESLHFDIRYRLVQYDDILDQQRKIVYELRRLILVLLEREPQDLQLALEQANLDVKDLTDALTQDYINAVANFTLKNPYDFGVEINKRIKGLFTPLRFWLYKQLASVLQQHIPFGQQVTLSTQDFRVAQEYLDLLIPDQLWEQTLKTLGLTQQDFKKLLNKTQGDKDTVTVNSVPIFRAVTASYVLHLQQIPPQLSQAFLRMSILPALDYLWMEHMDAMNDLRESVGLAGYAQRDPLVEYKQRASVMFDNFFKTLGDMISKRIFHINQQVLTRRRG